MIQFYRKLALFLLLGISVNSAFSQSAACDTNLRLLNSDLISMLNKIPAMPPVAQIYRPVRDLYEEAKVAKDRGNYSECVNKTELALKYSKPYGNR
jgi:hypothetical protein